MSVASIRHLKSSSLDVASFESLHLCLVSKELTLFAALEAVFAETFHHALVILLMHRQRGSQKIRAVTVWPDVIGFAPVGAPKRAAGMFSLTLARLCLSSCLCATHSSVHTWATKRQC